MCSDIKPRVLSTAIDLDDTTASVPLALEVADHFRLEPVEARQVVRQVADQVRGWREEAARLGLSPVEIDRMSSAFEHADLSLA